MPSDGGRKKRNDLPWRKAYPHEWESPAVQRLTPRQKLVWKFLSNGPQTNRIGYYHWKPEHTALTLGMTVNELARDFQAVIGALGWRFEPNSGVVWNPAFFRQNAPDNPDHARGIVKDLEAMPRSVLDVEFLRHTKFLPDCVVPAFQEAVRRITEADPDSPRVGGGPPFEDVAETAWAYYESWLANADAKASGPAERLANYYAYWVGVAKGLVAPAMDAADRSEVFETLLTQFDEVTSRRILAAFIEGPGCDYDYWLPLVLDRLDDLLCAVGIPHPLKQLPGSDSGLAEVAT